MSPGVTHPPTTSLSVQNTLLLTYFPFHSAPVSVPRLAANTESDISHLKSSVGAEQEHIILVTVTTRGSASCPKRTLSCRLEQPGIQTPTWLEVAPLPAKPHIIMPMVSVCKHLSTYVHLRLYRPQSKHISAQTCQTNCQAWCGQWFGLPVQP